jgi:cytochrome oxidase assembly protein ShyY1
VLRTALKPRWLALLAVVLVAAAVMARLGEWQLDRARQKGDQDRVRAAEARPPAALTSVLAPRTAFPAAATDLRVSAQGRWDGSRQLLVPGRRLADAAGLWVLTPLRMDDGSAVAVVRGWVPDAGDPSADPQRLPRGPVTLTGVLEPSEPVADLDPGDAAAVPAGQVALVSAPLLVQHWPYPLLTGYVVQTAVSPTGPGGLRAVSPPTGAVGLSLQNLSYALQWWLFSAFGFFFWWRIVRDDHRGRLRPADDPGPPDPSDDPDPPDQPLTSTPAGERS